MRVTVCIVLAGLGLFLRVIGGLALVGVFFAGIYALFAKSVAIGLMMIGGVVVGGWVVAFVSGLLFAAAAGAARIGVNDDEELSNATSAKMPEELAAASNRVSIGKRNGDVSDGQWRLY